MARLAALAARTGLSEALDAPWAFVAGTMFWLRPALLLSVLRRLGEIRFDADFTRDGAMEHGLERLLGLALSQVPGARVARVRMDGKVLTGAPAEGALAEDVDATMAQLHAIRETARG